MSAREYERARVPCTNSKPTQNSCIACAKLTALAAFAALEDSREYLITTNGLDVHAQTYMIAYIYIYIHVCSYLSKSTDDKIRDANINAYTIILLLLALG